jgi:hypothetical protein
MKVTKIIILEERRIRNKLKIKRLNTSNFDLFFFTKKR